MILLLSAVARFGWVLSWPVPSPSQWAYDEANFHEAARRLLSSGYFAYGSGPIGTHSNALTMPGYTLFVALFYSLFPSTQQAVRAIFLAQAILGVVTVWLVYLIGRRVGGASVGLVGAAIAAVYPPAVFITNGLMTEPLYTAMLTLFIYASLVMVERPRLRTCFAVGAIAGLAALVRPVGALLVGLPLVMLLVTRRVPWRRFVAVATMTLLGISLVMMPWVVRNYRLHHRVVVFTTAAGNPALCAAYWPETVPTYVSVWPTSASDDELALTERWSSEARDLNDSQWRADPRGFLLKRVRMLRSAALLPHGLLWMDGSPMTASQIWTNRGLRVLYGLIFVFSVIALAVKPKDPAVWMVAGAMGYFLVMYSLILPLARYAFPSVMLASPLAGLTLVSGVRWWIGRSAKADVSSAPAIDSEDDRGLRAS